MAGTTQPFPFTRTNPIEFPGQFADLRANRPVAEVPLTGGGHAYLVTRHDDVKSVLSDPRFTADFRGSPDSDAVSIGFDRLRNSGSEAHLRMRRLVSSAMTPRRIQRLRPSIQQIADDLLDEMLTLEPPVDFNWVFAIPYPVFSMCELLGVPAKHREDFCEWSERIVSLIPYPVEEVQRNREELVVFLEELVADKRARPAEDLISVLATGGDGDTGFTDAEIISLVMVLLFASHQTSVNQIGNGLVALLRHPDQMARLREDPDLLEPAVEELLRHDGPGDGGLARRALSEARIGDVTIPEGSVVLVSLPSANRDDRHIEDPEVFDITRERNPHLAFGHGLHFCVGAALARLELRIFLETLLRRLPGMRLAVEPGDLQWVPSLQVGGFSPLPVSWPRAEDADAAGPDT